MRRNSGRIWSRLADALYRHVPSGVGVKGSLHLNKTELDQVLVDGSRWALKEGFARKEDVAHTEEGGRMAGADPAKVSSEAKNVDRSGGHPRFGQPFC